jgi:hypothetical protein
MHCTVPYRRERNDGLYRPIVYLAHKVVEELLLIAPLLAGTSAIVWYGVKLQGSFLLFWLISYATLANGIGGWVGWGLRCSSWQGWQGGCTCMLFCMVATATGQGGSSDTHAVYAILDNRGALKEVDHACDPP